MAAISDKITKTMSSRNPATTTVAAQRAVGATELRGVNLDGWQDETATHFITYKVDAQGELVEGSQTDWKGVVNRQSNSIVNLKRTGGAADQGNAIGDVIESAPTAAYGNELAEALLRHHDTEGRLKPKTVTYDHIDENTEYKHIASPNDLNAAQFLVPGKWRFGSNDQVKNTKNLPLDDHTGVLETIAYSGSAKPGVNPWAYVIQRFTTLTARVFVRVVNSGASSSAITFGAWRELIGEKIKTHKKDDGGWIKRELPDGVTEYSNTGRVHNVYTQPHVRVADRYVNLPSGISNFNSDAMAISAAVRAHNPNLITSISIAPNDHRISISRANLHNGDITSHIDYNIILRVYPK